MRYIYLLLILLLLSSVTLQKKEEKKKNTNNDKKKEKKLTITKIKPKTLFSNPSTKAFGKNLPTPLS